MAHAYILPFSLSVGAGQTCTASVLDSTGVALVSQPAYSIVDMGNGYYFYYSAAMPDGQVGVVKILLSTTIVAVGSVSPAETEATGKKLASDGVDAITVESGVNARQALSVMAAAMAGTVSGADTNAPIFKGANVATTRITATTDSYGNRSLVTLNLPS